MRRIVIEREKQISIDEVNDKSFVGIEWESGVKCMVIKTTEGFCSIANDWYPNTMHVWYAPTVKNYLEQSLKQGNNTNSRAYAFNNSKELYAWMSL